MDNYKKYFTKAVKNTYPNTSDFLISEIDKNFKRISKDTNFALKSTNPIDKRLDFSAYFLALIKTLDGQGETFETIRKICLEIVVEYVRPKNKIQQFLKRLPAKLTNTWLTNIFLKSLGRKVSQKVHQDGFVAKIITDKNETFGFGYGFDILECGICKLFKKHNYEKYSSILCEVDEITSRLAGLKLIRTSTIALGAKKCDFRFKKEITN
jgi:L-2-amino-thiazoline-4-carboxylic acid hydrolase